MARFSERPKDYYPQEQDLARDLDRELSEARRRPRKPTADEMLREMEARPRTHAETFGIAPAVFEHQIPAPIRNLSEALHRYERQGQGREDIAEIFGKEYSREKLDSDRSEVLRIQRAIDRDDTFEDKKNALYALTLEYIVSELANEWFPDCVIWKSNAYDDLKRQTDMFMDVPGPEGGVYTLAIDVTFSHDGAAKKLKAADAEFDAGRFHDVEYFASDTDPERQRGRKFFPRVVVGASHEAIARMAYLYERWFHNAAAATGISKREALQRLHWHALAGEMYVSLLRQIDRAYDTMRRKLKQTPTEFTAARESLKEHGRYLDAVRRSLDARYRAWQKDRAVFLAGVKDEKKKKDLERELEAPRNGVLEAIEAG